MKTYYSLVTTIKYNVYSGNQWVLYNDAQLFADKIRYLTGKCLSGVMIWALDQDESSQNYKQLAKTSFLHTGDPSRL